MRLLSTASKYSSNLDRSWPPSASPNSLHHGLQVHLQTRSITASKCISKLSRLQPPSASLSSLDHGPQVHLQTPRITASKFARLWPPSASPNSLDYGLQVHLSVHSISASKCISQFTRSRPSSASPNSLDHDLPVHFQTRLIPASKCISEFTPSRPPRASQNSIGHGLQVHLSVHSISGSKCISKSGSITASKYNVKERRWVYGDTGVTEVEWAMQSIYSGDPGVDRQHLIFISSCHTTKIHTLSFPTFGLTRSVRDVDPCNCVDPHGRVVSYLLTFFLRSSRLM